MHRTCGEPDEIKKNTHPINITALFREQDTCGKKNPTNPFAAYCEWAGSDTNANGPTFVCSTTDDGAAAWTIQDEGECSAGGGVDDSVCDYLEQTDCLNKGTLPCNRRAIPPG